MIDVQTHHDCLQVRQILAGIIDVGAAGTVAGRYVKISVGADDRLSAVVAAGRPLDDDGFRLGAEPRRIAARLELIPRDSALLAPRVKAASCPRD